MKELFVHMANAMPIEKMLTELKKAIIEHEKNPTKDNLQTVTLFCIMVSTKSRLNDQTPAQLIAELENAKRAHDLLTPKEN